MAECQPDDAFGQLLNPEQQRNRREWYLASRLRSFECRHADCRQRSAGDETC